MATKLYIVGGVNPLDRQKEWALICACFFGQRITVLASAEIFAAFSVEAQAKVLEQEQFIKTQGVHVLRLSPGCACCSSKLVLSTHIGRTLRLSQPDVLVLELDSQSHLQQVRALFDEPQWASWFSTIELREV